MLCTNKLSQHAFSQLKAREARHTIPACSSLNKLSQHSVRQSKAREARHAIPACSGRNHRSWKLDTLSHHTQCRHTIPTYIVKINLYKRGWKAQNSGQADTASSCTTRRTRTRGAAEQAATTPWETRQEARGTELHQLRWELEDQ